MVRKKFDRTVVKKCSQCNEHVPVACKFCTCGHQFATRNKILLKEEAEEAMGLLDGSTLDTKGDDNSSENRRRPRRLTRERPNYYVITTELSRHVKKKVRQKDRNRSGAPGLVDSNNVVKKKKRGRPRGSGSSSLSPGTRTRSKTRKLLDHYPSGQSSSSPHSLQIKKEELGFNDSKSSSISSSLSYGCVGDKPLTNVTVSICTAPNSCCTTNLSNCNITKHHTGNQGNNSSYSSSSDGNNSTFGSSHSKDISHHHHNLNHLNTLSNNKSNKHHGSYESQSNASSTNSNSNSQKDNGSEKDMYSSMSFEKAMKCYAILSDLNRKIMSQSFKPF